MGYSYGIENMREVLLKLCDEGTFSNRLFKAISELEVSTEEDLTQEHFDRKKAIIADYRERNATYVNESGDMVEKDSLEIEKQIADRIVRLAVDLIQENVILQKEHDAANAAE